jgi:hypothetical protein
MPLPIALSRGVDRSAILGLLEHLRPEHVRKRLFVGVGKPITAKRS